MRNTVKLFWGFALVFLGILGLILPVMPGWVFLIPGLVILSERYPRIRRLLDWARQKAATAAKAARRGE
ncbi:MAG: PGPGW domain-containing protein [Bryobacteraceae bacterium]